MRKTGAEILWEILTREGVDVVFGYPGGANMPIYDAMLALRGKLVWLCPHPDPELQTW